MHVSMHITTHRQMADERGRLAQREMEITKRSTALGLAEDDASNMTGGLAMGAAALQQQAPECDILMIKCTMWLARDVCLHV